ncbi:hypothetical protein CKN73_01380 [Carnobacterium divergens]|uniref:hypothetical protein n=1 Tax=Carnobacterium divergens TaxID=2748 RepID=UPI001072059D|nr:hypothetical protein [Carnobacterium divergens]TFJ45123.1 hypothetical protein CKN77_01375 [Carnobacterium divergens]TFJ52192.1 hypothetical protein CKN73_01380 [Carnobacterium divergens]TFJ57769.1 hypothetical protein CKN83_01375 [Carnobacterium divergens]TFJ65784.1 hypothetical protein CKN89_01380 [Carnobacterium divergens]TFJ74089.1 hypothetical protein CKN91_01375 [Carnobacterium divergens]
MTDKKYTHKIVMYDVNGLVRTARFESEKQANNFQNWIESWPLLEKLSTRRIGDSSGEAFNMNNIVQINPVEVIEG